MSDTRTRENRSTAYDEALDRIDILLEGETDWVAAMATVVCELRESLDHFDWVGFYRAVGGRDLVIGPYQGTHGCLRIRLGEGVCGTAAQLRQTVVVPDVHEFSDHIACDERTLSEIVVPVIARDGSLLAVLDVDSHRRDDFGQEDQKALEALCANLGTRFGGSE